MNDNNEPSVSFSPFWINILVSAVPIILSLLTGEGSLMENIQAFIDHMVGVRPAAAKGIYLQRVTISTTMGPGLRLAV